MELDGYHLYSVLDVVMYRKDTHNTWYTWDARHHSSMRRGFVQRS